MGLKSLRLEKGWSQEQLATISGLSERTIQRAERGETPSLETQRSLAASFELSPSRLRDLIQPQQERPDMATPDITMTDNPKPTTPIVDTAPPAMDPPVIGAPIITPALKRVVLAGAIYIVVMTWLALMQVFAGWDPEILSPVGIFGAGLVATLAFSTLVGDKPETAPKDGADGSGRAD
jgi:transcriptional regulator with XRE-family HTH domain